MEVLMETPDDEAYVGMESVVVVAVRETDEKRVSRGMDGTIDGALYDVEMNLSGEEAAGGQMEGADGAMEIEDNSPAEEEVAGIMEFAVEEDDDVEMMYEAEEVMDALSAGREIEMDGLNEGAVPFAEFLAQANGGADCVEAETLLGRQASVHESADPQVEAFVMTDALTDDVAIVSAVEVSVGEDNQTLSAKEIPVVLVSDEAFHAAGARTEDDDTNKSESSSEDGGEEGQGVLVGIGSYVMNSGLTITEVAGSTISIEAHLTQANDNPEMATTTTNFVVAIPKDEVGGAVDNRIISGEEDESRRIVDLSNGGTQGNVEGMPTSAQLSKAPGASDAPIGEGVEESETDATGFRLEGEGGHLAVNVEDFLDDKLSPVPFEGSCKSSNSESIAGIFVPDEANIEEAGDGRSSIDLVIELKSKVQGGDGLQDAASRAELSAQDGAYKGLSGMENRGEAAFQDEDTKDLENDCPMNVPPTRENIVGTLSVEEKLVDPEKRIDALKARKTTAVAGGDEGVFDDGGGAPESDKIDGKCRETMEPNAGGLLELKRRWGDTELEVEKARRSVNTSNGETEVADSSVSDADRLVEEGLRDVKKRSREESPEADNADGVIQLKAQKREDNGDLKAPASNVICEDDVLVNKEAEENSESGALQKQRIAPVAPRFKKRKIAIFLGYSGAGYQGMQKNPGAVTIEGELEGALYKAGAISEANFGEPKKIDWKRAARTDKGVSAVGQVVSGCFFIDPPGLVERVNSHLPKQIRVYGYKRATAGFDAKRLCDRRRYEYVLPVYAFDPNIHLDRETARLRAQSVVAVEIRAGDVSSENPRNTRVGSESETILTKETSIFVNAKSETAADGTAISLEEIVQSDEIADDLLVENKVHSGNGLEKLTAVIADFQPEITLEALDGAGKPPDGSDKSVDETFRKENSDASENTVKGPAMADDALQAGDVSEEEPKMNGAAAEEGISPEVLKSALEEKVKTSSYKYDEAEANRLNRILKTFQGNHNFHNFTTRVKSSDPSANRYILSFEAEKVFQIDGVDFVRCTVVGQSFMLHQIRKMIGLAVAIMRGLAPLSVLEAALRKDLKVAVPMAPELGLFLEECYFSSYNRRFQKTHEDLSLKSYEPDVSVFKRDFIYPHIASTEAKDSTFAMWLHGLNDRHFPEFAVARETENGADVSS